MASQFKCKICDRVYELRSDAAKCCANIEEGSYYCCQVCRQHHDDEDDAENCCCSYAELHDIEDYRKIFLPLKIYASFFHDDNFEFITEISENIFKLVLRTRYIQRTLEDAVMFICPPDFIRVNPTDIEINCDCHSSNRMKQRANKLLALLLAKPHWSLKLKDIDNLDHLSEFLKNNSGLQRLSGLLKNNGVDLDEYEILNHELTQKNNILHFNITRGEIFLTNQDNQVLIKINHINKSIKIQDPQWLLVKSNQMTNQTEALQHDQSNSY